MSISISTGMLWYGTAPYLLSIVLWKRGDLDLCTNTVSLSREVYIVWVLMCIY